MKTDQKKFAKKLGKVFIIIVGLLIVNMPNNQVEAEGLCNDTFFKESLNIIQDVKKKMDDKIDEEFLKDISKKDCVFPDIDYMLYY